jgi:hypothetical protein
MKLKKTGVWIAAAGLVLAFAACDEERETRTESRTVEVGGASAADVSLRMGAGELRMSGGAAALMEGRFTTNTPRWLPAVDYSVSGSRGYLTIRQKRGHSLFFGHRRNNWDVKLSDAVPIDLKISLGAGESRLDLRGLNLGSLDISMGVGEARLDLSGERSRDCDVTIEGGVGSGRIILPRAIGVRARVEGGIGSVSAHGLTKDGHYYTNDAYGKSPVTLNLKIEAGIGSIDLRIE